MKDEALDFLEEDTIRNLVKKYSQFINFPIYLWSSKVVQVDEDEEDEEKPVQKEESKKDESEERTDDEEDAKVEDAGEEKKTKKVDKTVWDWELLNDSKPIWSLKPSEVEDKDYNDFYKALTKDTQDRSFSEDSLYRGRRGYFQIASLHSKSSTG